MAYYLFSLFLFDDLTQLRRRIFVVWGGQCKTADNAATLFSRGTFLFLEVVAQFLDPRIVANITPLQRLSPFRHFGRAWLLPSEWASRPWGLGDLILNYSNENVIEVVRNRNTTYCQVGKLNNESLLLSVRDYRFAMLRPRRRVRAVPKYNEHNLIR